jgi:hypothetical protein
VPALATGLRGVGRDESESIEGLWQAITWIVCAPTIGFPLMRAVARAAAAASSPIACRGRIIPPDRPAGFRQQQVAGAKARRCIMPVELTSNQVWQAVEKELFAVIGMVTARQEARTVGVMYFVRQRKLYFGTESDTWKARHIAGNPHVSVTVPIAKRIPVLPWIRVPAATITFSGVARVLPATEASPDLLRAAFRGIAGDVGALAGLCLFEITPAKDFLTYGVGVPLMRMRHPEQARGRAPVG